MKNNDHTQDLQEKPDPQIIDEFSSMGRFGWSSIGGNDIPYIIRLGEKFCSVRMLETNVLNTWIQWFCQRIRTALYNCINIASYYVTKNEARLLNEISFVHCDSQFGRHIFNTGDLVIRLADASECYNFFKHCCDKLANKSQTDTTNRCGFIRINKESVVPFTVKNGQRYVPICVFNESDTLEPDAEKVEGWNLSYLKFCCEVQGIKKELLEEDFCLVTSLNSIKNSFPPDKDFEDYWPEENQLHFLPGDRLHLSHNVQWFRKPAGPPPKPVRTIRVPIRPNSRKIAANFKVGGSKSQSASEITAYQCYPSTSTIQMDATSRANHSISLAAAAPSMPPLSRIETVIPGETNSIVEQAPATVQILQPPTLDNNGLNTTTQNQNNSTANKELTIPIVPSQTPDNYMPQETLAYKLRRYMLHGKMFRGINSKPYVFRGCYLVTLHDLVNNLFIGTSAEKIQQLLQVLGIEVHKANEAQRQVLMEQGKFENVTGAVFLVDLNNLLNCIAPLKYMLKGRRESVEEEKEPKK
ncbi:unnamed protein product [Ceutorhynchus assimilis]|uniref:Uncharacterized protein n=1 Tax=Ceutorhynchus assimilis TaxID=467358 RepID=A0A9N9MC62_9CUCU|nr:unnamed protein product [Ceutorhynchus assimilis]